MRWLPTGDSATIVLIEDLGGSRYLAEVFRVADERRLHEIASGPRLVYALGYDVGLDLPEGPLALAESGAVLPPPDRVLLLVAAQGVGSEWAPKALPEEIRALKFALPSACAEVQHDSASITDTLGDSPTVLLAMSDEAAFMVTLDHKFFKLSFVTTMTGVTMSATTIVVPGLTSTTTYIAGARAPDGELWLFDDNRGVFRGTVESGFRPAPSRKLDAGRLLRVASSIDVPFELFALTADHGVERFDGQEWTTKRAPTRSSPNDKGMAIAWVESSTAFFIDEDGSGLFEISGNDIIRRPISVCTGAVPYNVRFHTVGYLPGLGPNGVLAGLSNGALCQRTPSGWTLAESTPVLAQRTQDIIPLGRGALVGGQHRKYTEWVPGSQQDCEVLTLDGPPNGTDANVVAQLGSRVVLAAPGGWKEGDQHFEANLLVWWLEEKTPPAR